MTSRRYRSSFLNEKEWARDGCGCCSCCCSESGDGLEEVRKKEKREAAVGDESSFFCRGEGEVGIVAIV